MMETVMFATLVWFAILVIGDAVVNGREEFEHGC